ncbi:hypothetical protein XSR1_320029 [Xenorhabdus szentirmaii DSM 16338]|uniref:Uncharacterized protein n=1 Tax=Xenorhabdus szentirmaii DSM 16338 TaxID=1427518 RepID=W1J283_9GAMM|nr:hypothetical protein XSR1_320029 [Xenorhabdus szentirmaii DSM 16338]
MNPEALGPESGTGRLYMTGLSAPHLSHCSFVDYTTSWRLWVGNKKVIEVMQPYHFFCLILSVRGDG